MFKKIGFFFIFLSGFTGLIYQVIWQRFLSQFLGSDSLATSLVLALFFLFIALGYEVLGKKIFLWIKNKFLLYGILEALIGVYALISPEFFKLIESLSLGKSFFSQIILSSIFIFFPTFLMGGTLPLLTQGFSISFKTSHITHAYLYALNCFGAVVGCLFAGFYLIENFGLNNSLFFVGQINILILPGIYLTCKLNPSINYEGFLPKEKFQKGSELKNSLKKDSLKKKFKKQKNQIPFPSSLSFFFSKEKILYTVSFLSGFYVFSIENLFIRMTNTMIGSSIYSYSMIVACFIFSLSLGSLLVTLFKKLQKLSFLIFFQGLSFISFYFLYLSIFKWPDLLNRIRFLILPHETNFMFYWFLIFLLLSLLLLIPIALMGTGLPLLFSFLKNKTQALSPIVGRLYGINAVGCALGSLIGGYFVFYFLETRGLFQMNLYLMLINFLLLNILCFSKKIKFLLLGKGFLVFFVIAILFLPKWDESKIAPGAFVYHLSQKELIHYSQSMDKRRKKQKIIYSHFGPNTYTHVTEEENNSRTLYVNGKPDANTKSDHRTRSLNILIPILFSPQPENIFIIGLGTGKSTQIATHFKETKNIDVSEISHSVSQALPYFKDYSQGLKIEKNKTKNLKEKMKNPNQKWNLFIGDAYRILKLKKNRKYDLIVSEPSNPWVTGVEKLFSIEFLSLAKKNLNTEGIYSQWFPLFQMSSESFLKILNNFNTIFPWTYAWATSSSTFLILGALKPIEINKEKITNRFNEQKKLFNSLGLIDPFSILGLQILTPLMARSLTKGYNKWHTQKFPKLAYESGRAYFSNKTVNIENLLFLRNLKVNEKLASEVLKKVPNEAKYFIFQNSPVFHFKASFYENTLRFMKKISWHKNDPLKFHENKIKFIFRKNLGFKKSKKYINEKTFRIYAYLSGLSSKFENQNSFNKNKRNIASDHTKEDLEFKMEKIIEKKARQWIRVYKNLIVMGFPRRWNRLNAIIPEKCVRKVCLKIKEEIKKLKN